MMFYDIDRHVTSGIFSSYHFAAHGSMGASPADDELFPAPFVGSGVFP
jgi:hypothetical protein